MTSISIHNETYTDEQKWAVRLFNKSILKQRKYNEIVELIGSTEQLHCLDIGSDNGVISFLLRQRGGEWKSADLDVHTVAAIRSLVKTEVYQIDGYSTPFQDDEFDVVVIVDFLEHISDDVGFINELSRIIKPSGNLIITVPHIKNGVLRRFRLYLGQTDEKHGHLRPGYTIKSIKQIIGEEFSVEFCRTYSKFFSELIDTLIVQIVYSFQRKMNSHSRKGAIITEEELKEAQKSFKLYSWIYPFVWLVSKMDALLFFRNGYMLIVKARANK